MSECISCFNTKPSSKIDIEDSFMVVLSGCIQPASTKLFLLYCYLGKAIE